MEKQSKKSEAVIAHVSQSAQNLPIWGGQMNFQELLFKQFQDFKSCHPYTRDNFETETKEIMNLIISNKISSKQLNVIQKILDEKYAVDSEQKLEDLAEQKFQLIDTFLQGFPDVSIQTDDGYEEIKQVSLEVYDLIILAAVRQKRLSVQPLTFEECSAIIQKAKIDYKIKSIEQFQIVLKRAIYNQNKLKDAFEKAKKIDKLQQINNKIQSIQQILQIFEIYMKKKAQFQEIEKIKKQEESLKILEGKLVKQQSNHFIFAIDGSGSMRCHNNWERQLKQIKDYLIDHLENHNNRVSIIVYDHRHVIPCVGSPVKDVEFDNISFTRGGTSPCEAFKGALTSIGKMRLNENIYFIYTSDGDGQYPEAEIRLMIGKKRAVEMNGFKFVSMAIKIGLGSGIVFDRIAKQLRGKCQLVQTAAGIGLKIREINNH